MTEFDEAAVERAAKALAANSEYVTCRWRNASEDLRDWYRKNARIALDAAAEPAKPEWPTTESTNAFIDRAGWQPGVKLRDGLRAAFLADPIIKAAVAWAVASANVDDPPFGIASALYDAVKNAGLLKQVQ